MGIYIISILKLSKLRYKAVSKLPNPFSWPIKIQSWKFRTQSLKNALILHLENTKVYNWEPNLIDMLGSIP